MSHTSELTTQDYCIHELMVDAVVKSRFNLDGWNVTTNPRSENDNVPDIVAKNQDEVVATGVVETSSTISEERALQWKLFGKSCVRFYIFVPEGAEETAADLITKYKVECAGLRCYSMNGHLDVKPVYLKEISCRDDDHTWWLSLGGSN